MRIAGVCMRDKNNARPGSLLPDTPGGKVSFKESAA